MRIRVIGMYGYRMQYTCTTLLYTHPRGTHHSSSCTVLNQACHQHYKENLSVQYNYDDFLAKLKDRLRTAHSIARERLIGHKEKSKEYYDKNTKEATFRVGDKVLLYDETVRRGRSKKLSSQGLGPYEVVGLDRVNATIKKGRRIQKVHLNRLKPFC
jgi:hypothetical protein